MSDPRMKDGVSLFRAPLFIQGVMVMTYTPTYFFQQHQGPDVEPDQRRVHIPLE